MGKNPRVFWEITPLRTITKYWEDGHMETWLADKDDNELYLIRKDRHPSGKSPIVEMKTYPDELHPSKTNDGGRDE